jgi:hypothetical protein
MVAKGYQELESVRKFPSSPLRLEGSTVEHTIEDRRAQVRLLLGTYCLLL